MAPDDWPEIESPKKGPKADGFNPPFAFPDPHAPRPRRRFRLGVRHIMLLVLASALTVWVGQQIGIVALIVVGVAILLATGAGALVLVFRGGAGMREAMLCVVANAAEKEMPLPEGVRAVGRLCGGGFQWEAERLAAYLVEGAPLPLALDNVPGAFPPGAVVFTRMGWPPGHLARALRDVSASRAAGRVLTQAWTVRIGYLVCTLVLLQLVYLFKVYWVLPQYQNIFADFGVPLPDVTRLVVGFSNSLVESGLLPVLILSQIALLPLLPLVFFDPLHWNVPLVDRAMRRRHGGVVARVLATEVEADRPLSHSVGTLASVYPSTFVRRRLDAAALDIDGGRPWPEALRRQGLIRRVDADVLEAAGRARNLPWALRDLAGGVERRFLHRLMAWSQVAFPVAVVSVAILVLFIAAAFFLPLVRLIEELSLP